jgi:uncharacterized lipoprotein YajG
MKSTQRSLFVVILALALLAGCGSKDKTANSTNATVSNTNTSVVVSSPPTTPTTVAQNVSDGATCSPQGAAGITRDGVRELCAQLGGVTRWRPA